jgi:hypothetical protein
MKKKFLFLGIILIGVVSAGDIYESYHLFNEVMASGEHVLGIFKTRKLEIIKVDVGTVSTSTKENIYKDLSAGYVYYISVAGQRSKTENLQARVFYMDPKGSETLVGLDTAKGNYPNIKLTPAVSGTYKVVVSVASMVRDCESGRAYYFLAIGVLKL